MPLEIEAEERGGALPDETVDADQAARRSPRGCTAAGSRSSTAARAGRCSSGSWSTSSSGASPTACTGTCRTSTTCCSRGRRSRSSATSCPRCAARAATPTRSPRPRPDLTPAGSPRPQSSTDGGWRINGEKWFVTSGDVARVLIVMANVVDGADRLPTLFLVEPDAPGVEFVDNPQFTHNYPHGHPTIRFTDVEVAADAVVGGVGNGDCAAARAGSPRSGSGSRPTASARCGGCSRRRRAGR